MRLMDIKYLKGSEAILKEFPHLTGAQVNSIFDKIIRNKDGSYVLKRGHPDPWTINIEDGRQAVWSNPSKYYCQHGQTPEKNGCIPWFGDKNKGDMLFKPGPTKDIGKVEYINWEEQTKKPSPLVWIILGIILWKILI